MAITEAQRTWISNLRAQSDPASPPPTTDEPAAAAGGPTAGSGGPTNNASDADGDIQGSNTTASLKRPGSKGPPADELEPGEGKNRDGTVRRKAGEGGRARGRDAKREQDGDVDDAVRDFGLTEDEREHLHQEVRGRDLDRDGIRKEAEAIKNGRKQPDKPPQPAEADPEKKAEPEISTADAIIAGAVAVAGTALVVGIAAAPVPVADVVVDAGAAVVIAGAGLVIGAALLFKAVTEDEKPPPEA